MFVIPCRKKITPALKVRAVASTHAFAQTAPTFRLKVRSAHAVMPFALAASFLTAATCVLQTHLVQSSYTTLHCASFAHHAHIHCIWVICSKHFLFATKWTFADNLKLHSLLTQGSLRFIPFHSVLLHSVSLQSTRCPCCARLRCRPGCGLSCFLQPCICWPTHLHLLSTKARHLP